MNHRKIKALDRDELQRLLRNAQRQDSTEAREIERAVRDELASRQTPKFKKVVKWDQPSEGLWEGYFAVRKVATITKVANHSNDERNVYHLILNGKPDRHFEYIDTAKRYVEDIFSKLAAEGNRH